LAQQIVKLYQPAFLPVVNSIL